MMSSGIIRRIDDLGRIVIPKEIRRTLHLKEGDPLEILIEHHQIVLRRFSPLSLDARYIQELMSAVCKTLAVSMAVCDYMRVLAATPDLQALIGSSVPDSLRQYMDQVLDAPPTIEMRGLTVSTVNIVHAEHGENAVLTFGRDTGGSDEKVAALVAAVLEQHLKY